MRILFLGGTKFLGKHLVDVALMRGHAVTVFNRAKTSPQLPNGVTQIIGDREQDVSALQHAAWDAVIDTSGYTPNVVRNSVEVLRQRAEHYTFISTISVYTNTTQPNVRENHTLAHMPDTDAITSAKQVTGENYGALKVRCEQEVLAGFDGRACIVRPGLIVGPDDPTDRFTYWVVRVAQGGQVLAPHNRQWSVQVIDVRDLAAWTLAQVETRSSGIHNATGPDYAMNFGAVLDACVAASNTAVNFVWADEAWLLAEQVQPWSDLPLWIPSSDADAAGFSSVNCDKAIADGLRFRPIQHTVHDTLAWFKAARGANPVLHAGLSHARELALIEKLQA